MVVMVSNFVCGLVYGLSSHNSIDVIYYYCQARLYPFFSICSPVVDVPSCGVTRYTVWAKRNALEYFVLLLARILRVLAKRGCVCCVINMSVHIKILVYLCLMYSASCENVYYSCMTYEHSHTSFDSCLSNSNNSIYCNLFTVVITTCSVCIFLFLLAYIARYVERLHWLYAHRFISV